MNIKKCPFCNSENFEKIDFSDKYLKRNHECDYVSILQTQDAIVKFCSDCNTYLAIYLRCLNELMQEELSKLEELDSRLMFDKKMMIIVDSVTKLAHDKKEKGENKYNTLHAIDWYLKALSSLEKSIIIDRDACLVISPKELYKIYTLQCNV